MKLPALFLPIAALAAAAFAEPAAGGAAEKGKPAASGVDALELVKVTYIPFRNNPNNPRAIADSPDSYAVFRYKWSKPGGMRVPDFAKRRGDTFTLPPEDGKKYKVIEIKGLEVVIELPDGTKKTLTVPE